MRQRFLNLREIFTSTVGNRKFTTILIVANICLFSLYLSGWSHAKRQVAPQKEKAVLRHPGPKNEPIEITEIRAKTKAVKLGEVFEDESDWLKHLTYKVKNRSDKAITFLQIDLDFPETEATAGAIMMHQLFFGQRSDFRSTLNNQPLYIKPNETIEISLERAYDDIKTLIELRHPTVGVINKLTIRTSDVMFEDGALYASGMFYRRNPDPNSPQKWMPIDTYTQGLPKINGR
jgi:hypothetical protein